MLSKKSISLISFIFICFIITSLLFSPSTSVSKNPPFSISDVPQIITNKPISSSKVTFRTIRTTPLSSFQKLKYLLQEGALKDHRIIVVSNREFVEHNRKNGEIVTKETAGGMAGALDPMLKMVGKKDPDEAIWIAWGSGDADFEVVDKNNKVKVQDKEGNPKYTQKRIHLTKEEVEKYYLGFANEILWPLSHKQLHLVEFKKDYWQAYKKINKRFAQKTAQEIKEPSIVLLQDYHLGLAAKYLKQINPKEVIAQFWHIPWPKWEEFAESLPKNVRTGLLEGLLGNDLLGFHTQAYCNNFIDTVKKEFKHGVEIEGNTILYKGHKTEVLPFPISIDYNKFRNLALSSEANKKADNLFKKIEKNYGISNLEKLTIGLGVDRLDYAKGIVERIKAINKLFNTHPELKEELIFIQINPPSRTGVKAYRDYGEKLKEWVDKTNKKHSTENWKPIISTREYFSHEQLAVLYKRADFLIVSSLADGMNLVSKEYIASQVDKKGMLLLSKFTGAAEELIQENKKAFSIGDPRNIEKFSSLIYKALQIPLQERKERMANMQEYLSKNDIFNWVYQLLKQAAQIESSP